MKLEDFILRLARFTCIRIVPTLRSDRDVI